MHVSGDGAARPSQYLANPLTTFAVKDMPAGLAVTVVPSFRSLM